MIKIRYKIGLRYLIEKRGTLFPHKNIHKVTWISPDRNTQNQIDPIAVSKKCRSSLLNVRSRRGADVYSDYHLLVGEIRIKLAVNINHRPSCGRRFDTKKLNNNTIADQFVGNIVQTLAATHPTGAADWSSVAKLFYIAGDLGFINLDHCGQVMEF